MGLAADLKLTDPLSMHALLGRAYYASDADQNDLVTGQTSFANTTPTFALVNPVNSNTLVIPLMISLVQTGTVAGDNVDVIAELDNTPTRFTSGTAEASKPARTRAQYQNPAKATLYSTVTAAAGYGVRLQGQRLGPDISPAEGAVFEWFWAPSGTLDYVDPGGGVFVHTYAGTTGPSWFWTFKWLEIPLSEL